MSVLQVLGRMAGSTVNRCITANATNLVQIPRTDSKQIVYLSVHKMTVALATLVTQLYRDFRYYTKL